MSWFGDPSGNPWLQRAPITIWDTTGTSQQAEFSVPETWDAFWDSIDANGHELRVTDADGVTSLDFQRVTFSGRICTIRITASAMDQNRANVRWLYWNKDSASDASTTVTPSSPLTTVETYTQRPSGAIVNATQELPGASNPAQEVAKTSITVLHVWWSLRDLLAQHCTPHNEHLNYAEVDSVKAEVYEGASTDRTSTMVDTDETAVVECDGDTFVRMQVKGGTSGTAYNMRLTVKTTDGQERQARAILRVQDLTE